MSQRVLVTRAAEDALPLAGRLRTAGLEPLLVPLIQRADAPEEIKGAVAACPLADVLLVTSPAAARAIGRAAPKGLSARTVAAVGPGTAAALERIGLTVDVMPDEARGTDLVDALGDLEGRRVLWLHADQALEDTRIALQGAKAVLVDAVAYRTTPHPDRAKRLKQTPLPDLLTFTSPSIVRALHSVLHELPPEWAQVPAVAIGTTTAWAVETARIPLAATASPQTLDGLVDAVVDLFRDV